MKKPILALLALLFPFSMSAGDDFGIWTSVGAEKKLNKKFSLEAGMDFRAEQKLGSIARWAPSLGVEYKPFKFLRFSAGYTYIYDRSPQEDKVNYNSEGKQKGYNIDHGYWRSKHRGYVNVIAKFNVGRFSFSLRERYQLTHSMSATCKRDRLRDKAPGGYSGEVYEYNGVAYMAPERGIDKKSSKNAHYLRSRLQVEYDIRNLPIAPFVAYELSNNLEEAMKLDKTRLTVGADWKINKKHSLSLGYIWQDGADDDGNNNIHVIDIGYKFKF